MTSTASQARRVLVCACGAAATLLLPTYLLAIKQRAECTLTVVMSATAGRFVPPRSIALLTDRVIDAAAPDAGFTANHVELATQHDLIIVLPATANALAQAAQGQAGTLISTILLAAPQPVIFVPTMNRLMWAKPVVERNVATLRADGHTVVDPEWKPGYELASHSTTAAPVMPAPARIGDLVRQQLLRLAPGPSPAAGGSAGNGRS